MASTAPEVDEVDDFLIIDQSMLKVGGGVGAASKAAPVQRYNAEWKVAVRYDKILNTREIALLKHINHNNIVRFFGITISDKAPVTYGYIEELCDRGNLHNYIHTKTNKLDLPMVIDFANGIASGVRYLHEDAPDAPIKHKNLTSHEVLLKTVKGKLIPKVSGFDYAKQHNPDHDTTYEQTTTCLLSPERINGERSSPESDIYSVGIIMSEMLSREEPFSNFKGFQAMQHVQGGGRPNIPSGPEFEGIKGLIEMCWAQEPDDRPTAGEVERQLEEMMQLGRRESAPAQTPTAPANAPSQCFTGADIDKRKSEKIGNDGSIGYAKTAVDVTHGEVVLKGMMQQYKGNFVQYVDDILCQIGTHENIVTVFGRTSNHIVMEKMPTSLESRLMSKGPITDKSEFLKIAIGVASGLHHIHNLESPMVHGRIHPRNVFLDSEMNAKISDAGYYYLDKEAGLSPTVGMEAYQAFEAQKLHSGYYRYGADVFSFGVLLIEMYTLNKLSAAKKERPKALDEVKNGWPELHDLVDKYTEPSQNGMLKRRKKEFRMENIVKELKNLQKKLKK